MCLLIVTSIICSRTLSNGRAFYKFWQHGTEVENGVQTLVWFNRASGLLPSSGLLCEQESRMKLTEKPQRHPDAAHQTVEEEAIIINVATGSYYSLNDTGTLFWELLDGQRTLADCAQAVADEYEVEVEVVEADLLELATEFEHEGLIVV